MGKNSILIHIPKTGGVSIQEYAMNYKINIKIIGKHEPAKKLIPEIKDYFSFAFVRNPYDRFMSSYYFYRDAPILKPNFLKINEEIQQYKTFEDFCLNFESFKYKNDIQFANQIYFILDENNKLLVDYVGKFENLASDWKEICNIAGWEHNELPHLNKTNHLFWEDEYNDNMKQIVFKQFANDFKYLQYGK